MSNFNEESSDRIRSIRLDEQLQTEAKALTRGSIAAKYSYNFFWLGRLIIQYPQDIVALQEIIWEVKHRVASA